MWEVLRRILIVLRRNYYLVEEFFLFKGLIVESCKDWIDGLRGV